MDVDKSKMWFIYSKNHPDQTLTDDQKKAIKVHIQKQIRNLIDNPKSIWAPRLNMFENQQAFIKILCYDNESSVWLENAIEQFKMFDIEITENKKPQVKLFKVWIRINKRREDDRMNFETFLRYLSSKNEWLNLKGAVYYDQKDTDDGKYVLVFFGVTESSMIEIKKHKGLVFFDVCQSRIMWPRKLKNNELIG